MNLKILSALIFSIFLISMASAMTLNGGFSGGAQSASITEGDSISFSTQFVSMNLPMSIRVSMYNSAGDLVYTFLNQNINNGYTYHNSYTITPSIYNWAGNYKLIISGTDRVNSDYHALTLTVNPVIIPPSDTTAPVITILGSNPFTITQGNSYTDAGATALDNVDGAITPSVSSNVDTNIAGTYQVIYSATDSSGNTATKTRTVNVVPIIPPSNRAPVIHFISNQNIYEGTDYSYQVIATDADGDALTYSLAQNYGWLTINSDGIISGTAPSVNSNTNYNIQVIVSDGTDSGTQNYILTVLNKGSNGGSHGGGNLGYRTLEDAGNVKAYASQFENKITYTKPVPKVFNMNITILYFIIISIISIGIIILSILLFRIIRNN